MVKNTKKKDDEKEEIKGLLKYPSNENYRVELQYSDSSLLKNFISFINNIHQNNIVFLFRKKFVIFQVGTSYDDIRASIKIDGTKVKSYYCNDSINLKIKTKIINESMHNIDKKCTNYSMYYEEYENLRKLNFHYYDSYKIFEKYSIEEECEYIEGSELSVIEVEENYDIEINMPSKVLIRLINGAIKLGASYIEFSIVGVEKKMKVKCKSDLFVTKEIILEDNDIITVKNNMNKENVNTFKLLCSDLDKIKKIPAGNYTVTMKIGNCDNVIFEISTKEKDISTTIIMKKNVR